MHSENAILDAMDSFSNEAGALMEEVYQYMIQYSLGTRLDKKALHASPRMHGRAKEKYKVKSNQICHCCFLPLFHVVTL